MDQIEMFPEPSSGRMSQEPSDPTEAQTSRPSFSRWPTSGRWSPSGLSWTHDSSECPSDDGGCSSSLSSILLSPADVPIRYFLSDRAIRGIIRRAGYRNLSVPEMLSRLAGPSDRSSASTQPSEATPDSRSTPSPPSRLDQGSASPPPQPSCGSPMIQMSLDLGN